MVFLTYLHAQISFTDSSTGAIYEVLKYHVAIPAFNVYNSDLNNGQSYRITDFDYYPNLLLQEDSLGQINFVVVTYGGSIQQETGIAPAAGDTVAITLNIGYQLIN
jgi:hypothetical protein